MGDNYYKIQVADSSVINNKQGSLFDIPQSSPEQRHIPHVCPAVTNAINAGNDNKCNENLNDMYYRDEESLIPKGLLDDRREDQYFVGPPNASPSISPCGIPCYIAVLPQSNASERQPGFLPIGGIPPYLQNISQYVRQPGSEYYIQNQRGLRSFNSVQQNRNFQSTDLNWWHHVRPNQHQLILNTGIDARMASSQRNPNVIVSERLYETYQPVVSERFPNDFQQPELLYNMHYNYGYENQEAHPNTKTFYKAYHNKLGKEFHLVDNPLKEYNILPEQGSKVNTPAYTGNFIASSKTLEQPDVQTDTQPLPFHCDILNSKYEKNDLDAFQKTALDGCSQLEQLLSNLNIKSTGINLEEFCKTMKIQLSHCKSVTQSELIMREMILGFLHICNSWICISSITTVNQDSTLREYDSQSLIEEFENWQDKSKVLLNKILNIVQNIPLDQQYIKEYFKRNSITKENNHTSDIIKTAQNYQTQLKLNKLKEKLSEIDTDIDNTNSSMRNRSYFVSKDKPNEDYTVNGCRLEMSLQNLKNIAIMEQEKDKLKNIDSPGQSKIPYYSDLRNDKNYEMQALSKNIGIAGLKENQKFCLRRDKLERAVYHSYNIKSDKTDDNGSQEIINDSIHENSMLKESFSQQTSLKPYSTNFSNKAYNFALKVETTINTTDMQANNEQFDTINILKENFRSLNLENQNPDKKVNCNIEDNTEYEDDKSKDKDESSSHVLNRSIDQNHSWKHFRNRRRARTNKVCSFTKSYNKVVDNEPTLDKNGAINPNTKLKLIDIFVTIHSADLNKYVIHKINELNVTKIRQCLTYPLYSISYYLTKDNYHSINNLLEDVYKLFFIAKCENKGNITLLTVANRLELKLMNMMYEEIGTC